MNVVTIKGKKVTNWVHTQKVYTPKYIHTTTRVNHMTYALSDPFNNIIQHAKEFFQKIESRKNEAEEVRTSSLKFVQSYLKDIANIEIDYIKSVYVTPNADDVMPLDSSVPQPSEDIMDDLEATIFIGRSTDENNRI
jgi:hypothetical protein